MTDINKTTTKGSRPSASPASRLRRGTGGRCTERRRRERKPSPAPTNVHKTEQVLGLLRREEGATLIEIVEATGWLSHSARAVLTGLRKKNHAIEKTKRGEVTCYVINASAERHSLGQWRAVRFRLSSP